MAEATVDPLKPEGWNRPWTLSEIDHETQRFCLELHKNGVYVDQKRRYQIERVFTDRYKRREARLIEIMQAAQMPKGAISDLLKDDSPDEEDRRDLPNSKPGSYDQIRDLLYGPKRSGGWDLGMPHGMEERDFLTASGLPGTGDLVLRGHLAGSDLLPYQRELIEELRLYRREKNKIVGTMLVPANRRDAHPKGLAWGDGRIRSTWNAHVVANARLSCSKPNFQNQGSRKGMGVVKQIYTAQPGHILLGADLDQAHLKIAANYWGIKALQAAFGEGIDPHVALAAEVVRQAGGDYSKMAGWAEIGGYDPRKKPKKGSPALAVRELAKTKRYTGMYGAGVTLRGGGRYKFIPDTILAVVRSTEQVDDDGNASLPYLGFRPEQVTLFHQTWMETEPDWIESWEWEMARWERRGYSEDPIFHRRSGILSGGKFNEVVNYPMLTSEAHIMRIAEWNVRQAFPFEYAGAGTGCILQVHDSIVVEATLPPGFDPLWSPRKGEPLPPEIETMRRTLEECMTITVPGWDFPLTAEASVGRSYAEV